MSWTHLMWLQCQKIRLQTIYNVKTTVHFFRLKKPTILSSFPARFGHFDRRWSFTDFVWMFFHCFPQPKGFLFFKRKSKHVVFTLYFSAFFWNLEWNFRKVDSHFLVNFYFWLLNLLGKIKTGKLFLRQNLEFFVRFK